MTCPRCNDTGEQRYWEGRWRDEKAENERLRTTLRQIKETYGPNHGSKFCWKIACDALETIAVQQGTQTEKT